MKIGLSVKKLYTYMWANALLLMVLTVWSPNLGAFEASVHSEDKVSSNYHLVAEILKQTEVEINSTFRAYNFDEQQDRAHIVQLFVEPEMNMKLHKNFSIKGKGSVGLGTGRVQTRFDQPDFGTLNLNELILAFHPIKEFNLEAGALNQAEFNNEMFISEYRSFPGAQIKSLFEWNQLSLRFKAQYSIPTSTSLALDRTDNEAVPKFLSQGLDWQWLPAKWARLKGNVHHFTYKDLPSVVAFESGRLGNEVIGETPSESYFNYGHDGISQNYTLSFDLSKRFTQNFKVMVVDNLEAPSGRNRSQWTGLGWDVFFKDFMLSGHIAYFYAESDSVPALYSNASFGRNNREGFYYGMKLKFLNYGFAVSANYVQANLIEPDPVQNDLNAVEFLVELPSVKF